MLSGFPWQFSGWDYAPQCEGCRLDSWLGNWNPMYHKAQKGATENKIVGWHYQLNGHEFEQTLVDGEGQGSLACCSPWGCKE